jgi:3-methyl-2-oxobutanoate hydroxymethyltransferase
MSISTTPMKPPETAPPDVRREPVTVQTLAQMKDAGEPIVMISAYDVAAATLVDAAGIDIVLVGDTSAMAVLGYDSTVPVTVDEMLMLTAAVRRGLKRPLLVGDLPFGSYEISNEQAVATAQRFVKEAGADVVKLERGGTSAERARAIIESGIPVMGHVGLTPQTAASLGGYKAQGRTASRAVEIARAALELQAVGCFAIVFEAVPAKLTEALMPRMEIPVIGIGAGSATDGQVLILHDLVGLYHGRSPRFAKHYMNLREDMLKALQAYDRDVRTHAYPEPEHTYSFPPEELNVFLTELETLA